MSPTAKTPSTLVRSRSSVSTKPRSIVDALLVVAEPVGGRPAPDRDEQQLGLDHVAALDRDRDAGVGGLDALERACRCGTSIPRLRNARSSALDDASSSAATSRGSASTIVTSAPKRAPDAGELARRSRRRRAR